MSRFNQLVENIVDAALAGTMGNPGHKPSYNTSFTGVDNSDPGSNNSDPGGQSVAAATQQGGNNDVEQMSNNFVNLATSSLENILNMRNTVDAANTIRSVFAQVDPNNAEALAKTVEGSNTNWGDIQKAVKKKLSMMANMTSSLQGSSRSA